MRNDLQPMRLVPDLRAVQRVMRPLAYAAIYRAERFWVALAGGWHRHRSAGDLDPVTGRTAADRLRQGRAGEVIWPQLADALDRGVPQADLLAMFDAATDRAAEKVATRLRARAPQMLREHRAIRRISQRRIRRIWGPALDAFYAVYVSAEEIGSDLNTLHRHDDDSLVGSLLALHARTSLVLCEIHALMTQGFPLGAWARTRTLHETAVLATLLSEHGREEATDDLGERFLRHAVIDQAKDLDLALESGAEVDADLLAAVRQAREEAIADYGKKFAEGYGWARPLFPAHTPNQQVTFRELEELASLVGLERLDYRVGAHHIHASAWGLELSVVDSGGWAGRVTGSVDVGLAEPAAIALIAALASTTAIVHGIAPLPEPMDLIALRALAKLIEGAMEHFAEAQAGFAEIDASPGASTLDDRDDHGRDVRD